MAQVAMEEEVVLKYNAQNSLAKSIMDLIYKSGVFEVEKVEECPYDKEFMEKIRKNAESSGKIIKTEDLWK